jgi:drug/metabolite transporter (DMT)-like permease
MPPLAPTVPANVGRGIALMICTIALFSTMDAIAKTLLQDYGTVQVVWARYAGQSAIVALILAPRFLTLMRTRHPVAHGVRSIVQFCATLLFFSALAHIGLAEATAIMDVNPVLITLGAALFLGERLGPRRLFGVLAAMVGAMLIIRPGTGVFAPAALLPLAAAVCYATYALLTRMVGREESVWTALIYTALAGTVISTLALPWFWQPIDAADLPLFLLMGPVGATAQLFLIRAFTTTEASVVAPFAYLGLIFAAGWGYVLFGEVPDGWTVAGGSIIVAAGLYVWHRETLAARAARRAALPPAPPR